VSESIERDPRAQDAVQSAWSTIRDAYAAGHELPGDRVSRLLLPALERAAGPSPLRLP
jgi:hypothetical protein